MSVVKRDHLVSTEWTCSAGCKDEYRSESCMVTTSPRMARYKEPQHSDKPSDQPIKIGVSNEKLITSPPK